VAENAQLYTLAEVAERLRYAGYDRERSVRRLFERHKIPLLRRDYHTFLVSADQFAALLEAMRCSRSENEARSGTPVVRSEWVNRSVTSKNTLRDVIAKKMQKVT
jgi:hypothetical protein